MLYVFTRQNGLQIAWDSKAPRRDNDNRNVEYGDDRRVGYVRTASAG